MADGGGLATYPATIDNPRNLLPRIVTDIIIHLGRLSMLRPLRNAQKEQGIETTALLNFRGDATGDRHSSLSLFLF